MSGLGASLKIVELEGVLRDARTAIGQLRQLVRHAICAVCSDEIGEEDVALNDEEHLSHKRCCK